MSRIVFNDYIDATLVSGVRAGRRCDGDLWPDQYSQGLGNPQATAMEIGFAGAVTGGRHA